MIKNKGVAMGVGGHTGGGFIASQIRDRQEAMIGVGQASRRNTKISHMSRPLVNKGECRERV